MSPFGFQSLKRRSVKQGYDINEAEGWTSKVNISKGHYLSAAVHVNLYFTVRHNKLCQIHCAVDLKNHLSCLKACTFFLTTTESLMEDDTSTH